MGRNTGCGRPLVGCSPIHWAAPSRGSPMPKPRGNVHTQRALRGARRDWHRVLRVRDEYARTRSPEQTAVFMAHCRVGIRVTVKDYLSRRTRSEVADLTVFGVLALGLFLPFPATTAVVLLVALLWTAWVVVVVDMFVAKRTGSNRALVVAEVLLVGLALLAYLVRGRPRLSYSWFAEPGWHDWLGRAVLLAPLWL